MGKLIRLGSVVFVLSYLSLSGAVAHTHPLSTDDNLPVPVITNVPNYTMNVMFISANPSVLNPTTGTPSLDTISFNGTKVFDTNAVPGTTIYSLGLAGPDQEIQFALDNSGYSFTSPTHGVFDPSSQVSGHNGVQFPGSGSIYIDFVSPNNFDSGSQDWSLTAGQSAILAGLTSTNDLQYVGWMDYNPTDLLDPNADNSGFDLNAAFAYDNVVMAVWFVPNSVPEPFSWIVFLSGLGLLVALTRRRGMGPRATI